MKTLRDDGACTAAENALKLSLEFWLNILAHYYSEYVEERQKLNRRNLSSNTHSCMESEKSHTYNSYRRKIKNWEELHTKNWKISSIFKSKLSLLGFQILLSIASRTTAEKESRPSSPGNQCNRISHFELN